MNNMLNMQQTMERLGLSRPTVLKLIKQGKLKAVIISSRGDKRFAQEDIEQFIKENTR